MMKQTVIKIIAVLILCLQVNIVPLRAQDLKDSGKDPTEHLVALWTMQLFTAPRELSEGFAQITLESNCEQVTNDGVREPVWIAVCQERSATGELSKRGRELFDLLVCSAQVDEQSSTHCPLSLESLSAFEQQCEDAPESRKLHVCGGILRRMLVQRIPEDDLRVMCSLRYLAACFRIIMEVGLSEQAVAAASQSLCSTSPEQLILVRGYQTDFEEGKAELGMLNDFDLITRIRSVLCAGQAILRLGANDPLRAARHIAEECTQIFRLKSGQCEQAAAQLAHQLPQGLSTVLSCKDLSQEDCRAVAIVLSFGTSTSEMARAALEEQCDQLRDAVACDFLSARFDHPSKKKFSAEDVQRAVRRCKSGSVFGCRLWAAWSRAVDREPPPQLLKEVCQSRGVFVCILAVEITSPFFEPRMHQAFDLSSIQQACSRFPKFPLCIKWSGRSSDATDSPGADRTGETSGRL